MKARIRRISSSVDTALSPTSSSDACIHVGDLNSSTEISHGYNNNPSSKSLDICVSESRIERMRKLLSSPLLKRRNASQHSALCTSHHHKQLPPSSSSSSSPSSSPALASNASMKTFGVSLESLSHHQHPHHQQQQHHHQCPEYNVRDPEQIIVPHQKAAHILGQACPGCLTSNSSSNGSINDTSSGHFSSHCNQMEDLNSSLSSIVASPTSGNSSSSTTSSASSTGAPNSIPCLIPYIVTRLCNYIENSGGMLQEGLFRISGNAKLVEKLKQSFDQFGDAPLETDGDLAAASALLKQFLRELPQPLIPNGPQFLDVIRSLKNDHETCVLSLKALISQLPDENYYTLRYLIRFLYKIAQKNEENRMTSTNLGIIFAPNIFRVCVDTYQGLKDQSSANEVVNLLITDFTEIFNETMETVGQSVDRVDSFGDMSFDSNKAQCFCPFIEMNKPDCHSNCENLVVTIESGSVAQQPVTLNETMEEIMDGNNERSMILKLDRKRKTYQTKNHRTIDEFSNEDRCQSFDDEQNSEQARIRPQRCNSEEMFTKNDSNSNKIPAKLDDSYEKNLHSHEIIITNSSDSVSTDDNTTTATSTGPTVCSVIIGVEQIDICNQSGDMTDISEDNFGQNLPKYSKLLTCDMSDVKGPRSSSGGSDCTDNLNIPNSLSFASDEDDDSLMKSIASECSDNDSTGSNSARESIGSDNEQALKDSEKIETETKNDSIKMEQTFNSHLLESKPWSKNNDWSETEPTPISKHHLFSENSSDYNTLAGEMDEKFQKEALTSNSAFQYLSSNRAINPNETNFGPSPNSHRENNNLDAKQKFDKKPKSDESETNKIPKSRNRRLQSIRRKLKQFEIDFEQENGFKPSLENKMASSFARPLMLELSTILNTETNDSKGMEHFKKDLDFDLNKTAIEEDNAETETSHKYVWKYNQNNSQVFTTEDIFNTIFGSRKEKNLIQISEMINEIQRILQEKRFIAQRPESLDLMTSEQIFDEKLALQKVLLRFEALNGRPNSKAERDIVRPVYDRYRLVKRYAVRFNQKQNQKVENAELQPIIENVQMNFISPTHQQMSSNEKKNTKPTVDKVSNETVSQEMNLTGTAAASAAASSNIGPKTCDIMNSKAKNYHVMSHCELLSHLQEYRQQKRNLRAVLRTFENDFYKKTGRRVEKEDRSNMSSVYTCYKNTKAKIRLIEALVAKITNE